MDEYCDAISVRALEERVDNDLLWEAITKIRAASAEGIVEVKIPYKYRTKNIAQFGVELNCYFPELVILGVEGHTAAVTKHYIGGK